MREEPDLFRPAASVDSPPPGPVAAGVENAPKLFAGSGDPA